MFRTNVNVPQKLAIEKVSIGIEKLDQVCIFIMCFAACPRVFVFFNGTDVYAVANAFYYNVVILFCKEFGPRAFIVRSNLSFWEQLMYLDTKNYLS